MGHQEICLIKRLNQSIDVRVNQPHSSIQRPCQLLESIKLSTNQRQACRASSFNRVSKLSLTLFNQLMLASSVILSTTWAVHRNSRFNKFEDQMIQLTPNDWRNDWGKSSRSGLFNFLSQYCSRGSIEKLNRLRTIKLDSIDWLALQSILNILPIFQPNHPN